MKPGQYTVSSGRNDTRLQCRQRCHHLEGRSRRIGPLHRLVRQRAVVVFRQHPVIRRRNAAHEHVRIETRGRGYGQDVAAVHVDGNRRRTLCAQPLHRIVLQPVVQRHPQVRTRNAFIAVQFAHHAAGRIDLDPLGARRSAQLIFELGLGTQLADLEPRYLKQRVGVSQLGQVIVADRADIAQNMREIARHRIDAAEAHLGRHAGQRGRVDRDTAEILPAQPVGHGDGQGRAAAFQFLQRIVNLFGGQGDQAREPRQNRLRVARILARHGDAVILLVARDQLAVAVEDHPARGRQQADLDAVLFGEQLEPVGFLDLHVPHAQRQHAHHRRLRAAQEQAPAADQPRAFAVVALHAPHSRCPKASTSPGATFRNPKKTCDRATTTG